MNRHELLGTSFRNKVGMIILAENEWSFIVHNHGGRRTAEVVAKGVVIHSARDVLDILARVIWNDEADDLAVHESNVTPEFFDLSTGVLGEILQKCSNYRFRMALIGDFEKYASSSLQAFIRESNRGRHVFFSKSLSEALNALRAAAD